MTSSKRLAAACAIAAALLAPAAAHAFTSPEDLASARDLVRQGREARKANDMVTALEKFRAAYALAQTAVTGIELARTEETVGQLVEAREVCLAIARMPIESDETHLSTDARAEAADLAQKLAPRIPSIIVRVSGAQAGDGTDATVDGDHVPFESLGETRKVDPGTHAIVVKRGDETESAQVTVGEGENKEVTLALKPSPVPPPVPPNPPPNPHVPANPPPHVEPPAEPESPSRAGVWIGFTIAALGATVGTITGIMTLSKASSLSSDCPDQRCTPDHWSELDSANTLGTVSTFAFGAALVGTVIGIYSLTRSSSSTAASSSSSSSSPAPPSPTRVHVAPALGLGSFGLHGSF